MKNVKFYEEDNKGFAVFYDEDTETKAGYCAYFNEVRGKVDTIDICHELFRRHLAKKRHLAKGEGLTLITEEQAALKYPEVYAFAAKVER